MLARSGRLPIGGDWAYEVKGDGFRAIVATEGELRVRSRRGWNMTPHVEFLARLPVAAGPGGGLGAFGAARQPAPPPLCEGARRRRTGISLTFMAFDVLSVEGSSVMKEPYQGRRRILESLGLDG